MPEFLSRILETTRQDLSKRKLERPLELLRDSVRQAPRHGRSLVGAVCQPGVSVIAEIKRASPSKGDIHPDIDVAATAAAYERAGAAALSVLTEERNFKGSLADVVAARRVCGLPILRKDFIIDEYQIWEAVEADADAVLLIVAAVGPHGLRDLYGAAQLAGLECLVEVHDRAELDIALDTGVALIGINNRDLKTFRVDLDTTINLIEFVSSGVPVVSESGIRDAGDIRRLGEAGAAAVLIGEALMSSEQPGEALVRLLDDLG